MSSHRCQPKGTAPLCACGCGQSTLWNGSKNRWSTYISGHQNINRVSLLRKDPPPAPPCACGCALPVKTWRYKKGWALFLNGHAPRQPHTPEAIEKMRQAAQGRKKFGADNPAWHGGTAEETYQNHPGRKNTHRWRKIKAIVHERDQGQCVLCGKTERLDVHHVDGNLFNDAIANLVSLCHRCHMQVEFASDQATSEQLAAYMATL